MGKLPGFTFYTGDWLKDPALRCCSLSARGMWMDLLALMFECPVRGMLAHADGKPWTDDELVAAISGCEDMATKRAILGELLSKGVASRNKNGCVYSRRMVTDETERQQTKGRVRKYRKRICNANVTPKYEDENEEEVDVGVVVVSKKSKSKPTFEELCAYAKEIGLTDPEQMWDFYESKGWKVGSQPMKDWQASARNWKRRNYSNGKQLGAFDGRSTAERRKDSNLDALQTAFPMDRRAAGNSR